MQKKLVYWYVFVIEDNICVTEDVAQREDTLVGYNIPGRASRDVHIKFQNLLFFNASWVFIVTWHNVTFYGATPTPRPVYKQYFSLKL